MNRRRAKRLFIRGYPYLGGALGIVAWALVGAYEKTLAIGILYAAALLTMLMLVVVALGLLWEFQ